MKKMEKKRRPRPRALFHPRPLLAFATAAPPPPSPLRYHRAGRGLRSRPPSSEGTAHAAAAHAHPPLPSVCVCRPRRPTARHPRSPCPFPTSLPSPLRTDGRNGIPTAPLPRVPPPYTLWWHVARLALSSLQLSLSPLPPPSPSPPPQPHPLTPSARADWQLRPCRPAPPRRRSRRRPPPPTGALAGLLVHTAHAGASRLWDPLRRTPSHGLIVWLARGGSCGAVCVVVGYSCVSRRPQRPPNEPW